MLINEGAGIPGYDEWKLSDGSTNEMYICHACGKPIQGDLYQWHGNFHCEECLREILTDQLEEAMEDARVRYWV